MANKTQRSNKHTPSEISDAMIRRFLLARLDSEQQSAFEQSLFADPRLEQRVRLGECELTDDYAFGRLSIRERQLFEQKFLVSSARKHQLTVSNTLRDRFTSVTAKVNLPLKRTFTKELRSVFNLRQLSWKIAFAALLFLLLVGTSWLVIKKEPQIKEEITRRFTGKRAVTQTSPVESNHPVGSSSPQHEIIPSPLPEHEQTTQSLVIVALKSGLAPDKAPSIALPQRDHALVRFELTLKSNQSSEYRAELLTAEGETVFDGTATFSAPSDIVSFDVPARLLKNAGYQIRLLNARSNATVAIYYFRVQ